MLTVLLLSCGRPELTRKTIESLITLNPEFKDFISKDKRRLKLKLRA